MLFLHVPQEMKPIDPFTVSLQNSYISKYLEVSFRFKVKLGKIQIFKEENLIHQVLNEQEIYP